MVAGEFGYMVVIIMCGATVQMLLLFFLEGLSFLMKPPTCAFLLSFVIVVS